jgi:hypothetical protein
MCQGSMQGQVISPLALMYYRDRDTGHRLVLVGLEIGQVLVLVRLLVAVARVDIR